MLRILSVLAILTFCLSAMAGTVESAKVKTARGASVDVLVNIPDHLSTKNAAVVIAPGQGYNMTLPIVQGLAEKLAADGIIAYRFNWNYYSTDPQNGQPSDDLSNEVQDMQAVIALAKADARVDVSQLILAGKSLGTVVSYEIFRLDTSAKALVLMTPLCTSDYDDKGNVLPAPVASGAQNYPNLSSEARPIEMILGNKDPNCSVPMLYDFLKNTQGNISTVVIGGDHSWNVSRGTDADSVRRNADNVAAGVSAVSHWIDLVLGR